MHLFTTEHAAKKLGVNRSRVLQLIYAGRLRAKKFGWVWMIRPADLEKVKDRKPGRPKGKPLSSKKGG